MMLPMEITNDGDGFTAVIPSIAGCESWAHTEEEALEKIKELAIYYMKLPAGKKIKTDIIHRSSTLIQYRLIL